MAEIFKQVLSSGLRQMEIPCEAISVEQCDRFYEYLSEQNAIMNLTAISGEKESAQLHFLDCASLLKLDDFSGKHVIDVGTGAGFPGVPMRLLGSGVQMTLLDSQLKRIEFLRRAMQLLDIGDVECIHARAEECPQYRECFDYAVSRAVAKLSVLCELCLPYVKIGGYFLSMKGPGAEQELKEASKGIKLLGGEIMPLHEYDIPGMDDTMHCIVIIKKVRQTPVAYPRRFSKIQKQPL